MMQVKFLYLLIPSMFFLSKHWLSLQIKNDFCAFVSIRLQFHFFLLIIQLDRHSLCPFFRASELLRLVIWPPEYVWSVTHQLVSVERHQQLGFYVCVAIRTLLIFFMIFGNHWRPSNWPVFCLWAWRYKRGSSTALHHLAMSWERVSI